MATPIYGVDPEGPVSPPIVCEALVECVYQAHCHAEGIEESQGSRGTREYCRILVKNAFSESGGDYDRPTKTSIMSAMGKLREEVKAFKDPAVIKQHTNEMMTLVNKLQD